MPRKPPPPAGPIVSSAAIANYRTYPLTASTTTSLANNAYFLSYSVARPCCVVVARCEPRHHPPCVCQPEARSHWRRHWYALCRLAPSFLNAQLQRRRPGRLNPPLPEKPRRFSFSHPFPAQRDLLRLMQLGHLLATFKWTGHGPDHANPGNPSLDVLTTHQKAQGIIIAADDRPEKLQLTSIDVLKSDQSHSSCVDMQASASELIEAVPVRSGQADSLDEGAPYPLPSPGRTTEPMYD